jgi:hypothetical protein
MEQDVDDRPREDAHPKEETLTNIYAAMDQLFAETLANRIICMRMWGNFAQLAAQAEGTNVEDFVQKNRLESLQSVDLWNFPGHKDPEGLKFKIKNAISIAFNGLVRGAFGKPNIH